MKKKLNKASVFISIGFTAVKESNFKCEAYVIRQGRLYSESPLTSS